MANIYQSHAGNGDNVAGDKVAGDKNVSNTYSQDLTQAAKELQSLLNQLSQAYSNDSNMTIGIKAIEEVESSPKLKERVVKALRAGGETALEELVDHPAVSIVVAAIRAGFLGTG